MSFAKLSPRRLQFQKTVVRTTALAAAVSLATFCISVIHAMPATAQEEQSQPERQMAPLQDFFVRLDTDKGPIIIKVFYSMVPHTAGNFLDLVQRHFYDGLTFHRVEHWVIQGGDPTGRGTGNFVDPQTGQPVFLKLEIDKRLNHNTPGMVAMARGADPDSASCQFYIIKAASTGLNGKYAVFGQVVEGLETVFEIRGGDRIQKAQVMIPPEMQEASRQAAQPVPQVQQAPVSGDPGF